MKSISLRISIVLVVVASLAGIGWYVLRPSPEPTAAQPAADSEAESIFLYDRQYPAIAYTSSARSDRIALLADSIASDNRLQYSDTSGYLESFLDLAQIDPASQVLVFSKTSLQTEQIDSQTPRAIYFNDDTYVAWVPSGPNLEIAAMDPVLGPVFYTIEQTQSEAPGLEAHLRSRCLRCHDSLSLSGGGVPRFITGSGYIDAGGNMVSHEGWILTSPRTPIRNRWGGWYVTGEHGDQPHLGNMTVELPLTAETLEAQRVWNIDTLDQRFDTSAYPEGSSDIGALMVLEHQVYVQNLITEVNFYLTEATAAGTSANALQSLVEQSTEPLVEAMLFVDEVSPSSPLQGSERFQSQFEARGPHDDDGRTLRELDLDRRTLKFAPSYLVYSAAFDALPEVARQRIYRRFEQVLSGDDDSPRFSHLTDEDRQISLQILQQTKPDFVSAAESD